MRPLSEQDHYEILEIARDATLEEIERAFRLSQAIYADDSLAGYSVFAERESRAIRERLETAFRALSDAESRSAYDATLAGGEFAVPTGSRSATPRTHASEHVEHVEHVERGVRTPGLQSQLPSDALEALDEDGDEFDGARLRRSRLHRGLEIEDISSRTKINPAYLRFIEEDRFKDLPAAVYVRGFVTAYAACVGLDPARVAASYMKNFGDSSTGSRRGRSLADR